MQILRKIWRKLRGGRCSIAELRAHGLHIGENCYIGAAHIDLAHGYLITIGSNVTISSARILAHDASTKRALGYSKIGRVDIEDGAFVGAGAILLPGVRIGKNAIVGAGAVVTKDVPPGCVAVGNPAAVIGTAEDYLAQQKAGMTRDNTWHTPVKTQEEKEQIRALLEHTRIGFDL